MTEASLDPRIIAARETFEAGDWQSAFDGYASVVSEGIDLDADDLERHGYAGLMVGESYMEVLEAVVDRYAAAGRMHDAVRVGVDVARFYGGRAQFPLAQGWVRRVQRMLDDMEEGPGHAHMAVLRAFLAQIGGDLEGSLEIAEQAHALARAHGELDAEALALNRRGRLLVKMGRVAEGKADLDEAMVLVRRESTRPIPAALVYCSTIDACTDMADYERALQWTEAASSWIENRKISGFPGLCRVHRAELLRLRGDAEGAEREAKGALEMFERFAFGSNIAQAQVELGLQRLETGDLTAAEEAFGIAQAFGFEPQPGLAILKLRRGDPAGARSMLEVSLQEAAEDRLARARLLPTFIEACIDLGDGAAAREALDELTGIADAYGTVGLRAAASSSAARVHIFEQRPRDAILSARAGTREWRAVGAVYELERTHELLATAHAMSGEMDRAAVLRDVVAAEVAEMKEDGTRHAADVVTKVGHLVDGVPPSLRQAEGIEEGVVIDGRIEVGRTLGAGGMGLVYRGVHRVTGRDVAIKVLQRGAASDEKVRARFLNEARATGRIQHPNVVEIHDAGEHAGEPYIVMELLRGEPLSTRLRRDPALTVEEVVRVARQMAAGIHAAHAAGVVHRDLKPDNVFLCAEDGDQARVKVLDFGISKMAEGDLTRAGVVLGTPMYMAPEQVRDASAADERTDVHALGVLLFEMLSGKLPYSSGGAIGVLLAIAEGRRASLAEVRGDLPPRLVEVVERALAHDPGDRFQSAAELEAALGEI